MADEKKILFSLEVQGTEVAIKTQNDLTAAIKSTNDALKGTELGTDEYRKLEGELAKLKATQKDVADSAKIVQRQFEVSAANGTGTYRSLNAELTNARALFRELTKAEREGAAGQELIGTIQKLDAELKSIDASIGNFQRNVGNYPKEITASFQQVRSQIGQSIPGFAQLDQAVGLVENGIQGIGQTASATGKLLTGAFIGFQVASLVLDGVAAVKEFSDEIIKLRGNIQTLTGDTGEALDKNVEQIDALKNAFSQDAQELTTAANAVSKQFGISFEEAAIKIKDGFLAGSNANGDFLDQLKEYSPQFAAAGLSADQFFGQINRSTKEGIFSDKGADVIKEFGLRIREQTVPTRQALESAFGGNFTKELFAGINSGSITTAEALQRVSEKLNDTTVPANKLQTVIADVFGGPGEDAGLKYLQSLQNVTAGTDGLIDKTNDLTNQLNKQYEADLQLAQAKNAVTKELSGLGASFTGVTEQLETGLLNGLVQLIDFFKPVGSAISGAVQSVIRLVDNFGFLKAAALELKVVFTVVSAVFQVAVGVFTSMVNAISYVIDGISNLIGRIPGATSGIDTLTNAVSSLSKAVGLIPNVFAGMAAAARAAIDNVGGLLARGALEAQIFALKLKNYLTVGINADQINADIAALEAKQAAIRDAGVSLKDAFNQGFNSAKPATNDLVLAIPTKTTATNTTTTTNETTEQRNARLKKEKEEADRLDKLRKAALDAESKYNDERLALLRELSKRLADAEIDNINDRYEQQIAQERQKFADLQVEQRKQEEETVRQIAETREKIVAAYGERSKQVLAFDKKAASDLSQQQEQAFEIERQAVIARNVAITAIEKAATDDRTKKQLESLKRSLQATDAAYSQAAIKQATNLQAALNAVQSSTGLSGTEKNELTLRLKFEADQASLQTESVRVFDSIQAIEDRLRQLSEDDTLQAASIEEFNFLNEQFDALYNKRAQLEGDYSAIVEAEAQRRIKARLEEAGKSLDLTSQVVDLVDQAGKVSSERQLAEIQKREDAQNASIESIQEKLKTATGFEKAQLEARLKIEQDSLKKIAAEREKVDREERVRAKAFAIIQSIIQTALNVIKALGTGLVVPNIPAGVIAGALGAAQTALIAAQPLAEGGMVGIQETGNGLVVSAPNIPRMRNGDEILTTLKRGEVVLNQRQQQLLGGAPTFRAIRVPGFAEGGVAGSVISAPDITGVSSAERVRMLEALGEQTVSYIKATNERIDRIRTYVVSEDVQNDLLEGENLKTSAVLG